MLTLLALPDLMLAMLPMMTGLLGPLGAMRASLLMMPRVAMPPMRGLTMLRMVAMDRRRWWMRRLRLLRNCRSGKSCGR